MATDRTRLRRLLITAYLPTALVSIGFGAIVPMVPISAHQLGGSFELAAFIAALVGIGQLVGDLPAGMLASRFGERKALVGAAGLEAIGLVVAWQATSIWVLSLAVFVVGMAGSVFGLARQTYLTEAIPAQWRARALSTLGGVFRIGFFIGPLISAAIVARWGVAPAYGFAATMSVLAGLVTLGLPDLETRRARPSSAERPRLFSVLGAHRRVLVTLGSGAMAVQMVRAARQALLPLWALHIGLDPAVASVIFGISMGVDMTLFYLGGAVMDRFGRLYVVFPAMVIMGVGLLVLPLTDGAWSMGLVGALMGLGNGISAGIVMTLGSDASPDVGRAEFLGGWRLVSDAGTAAGPLLISGVAAVAPLAAACVATGLLAFIGAGWLRRWLPRTDAGT